MLLLSITHCASLKDEVLQAIQINSKLCTDHRQTVDEMLEGELADQIEDCSGKG